MIHRVILFALLSSILTANIQTDIEKTKLSIKKNSRQDRELTSNIEILSKKISIYKKELKDIQRRQKLLIKELKNYRSKSQKHQKKLDHLKGILKTLQNKNSILNQKLVKVLSKSIYISMLIRENRSATNSIDRLIEKEFFNSYSKVLKDKFTKFQFELLKLNVNVGHINKELNSAKIKIEQLNTKNTKLQKLNQQNSQITKEMQRSKAKYRAKLNKIKNENRALKKLLEELNILKQSPIDEFDPPIADPSLSNTNNRYKNRTSSVNVKRVGTSYAKTAVQKYRGKKTIAPFKRYKIARKFGNFTDPTYDIKMFNPNVVLKPVGNKNVINVLDGKVISITKSPAIGNIVVVDNRNSMHTLYAKLDRIAPTIKVGSHIKKGYILGRVKDELFFEVTKNSRNINPLELIN
jgi:murein DD-endopeptidase MepM/ murein hydrolase activator NlpD